MKGMSIVVTFHDEGPLAKMTLNSLGRCLRRLTREGIEGEVVSVLDLADARTAQIVTDAVRTAGPGWKVLACNVGDPSAARNLGISAAVYDQVVIADGDDYYTQDWPLKAYYILENSSMEVVHPEYVINFGVNNDFTQQISQESEIYDQDGLLTDNFWTSCVAANRRVFVDVPYPLKSKGFGFEDWSWNCRAIKMGYRHVIAEGTAMFYRRKSKGVMTAETLGRLIPSPHGLFEGHGE